jgi:hypothetical protein
MTEETAEVFQVWVEVDFGYRQNEEIRMYLSLIDP